jgi:hypothetical protein
LIGSRGIPVLKLLSLLDDLPFQPVLRPATAGFAQELDTVGTSDVLGKRLTKAPHLRQHLFLIRYGMSPPELLRLLDEPPSQLFSGVVLSQEGHFVSPVRNSVSSPGYHGCSD